MRTAMHIYITHIRSKCAQFVVNVDIYYKLGYNQYPQKVFTEDITVARKTILRMRNEARSHVLFF